VNYLGGFATAISAIYIKKMIDDRDSRKKALFALKNEVEGNLRILQKASRIYLLSTVAWESMNPYLAKKEASLFAQLANLYSAVNIRNGITILHNIASCLGRTYTLDIGSRYFDSGEWLDEQAEQLKKDAAEAVSELNVRLGAT